MTWGVICDGGVWYEGDGEDMAIGGGICCHPACCAY